MEILNQPKFQTSIFNLVLKITLGRKNTHILIMLQCELIQTVLKIIDEFCSSSKKHNLMLDSFFILKSFNMLIRKASSIYVDKFPVDSTSTVILIFFQIFRFVLMKTERYQAVIPLLVIEFRTHIKVANLLSITQGIILFKDSHVIS